MLDVIIDTLIDSVKLLPFLFLLLHVSYGLGTWKGLICMPFFRRHHKECPSVERVKECLANERTNA